MALAITSAVGLLIAQWFELQEPEWILISIVVILMPAYTDVSLTFTNVVHRIIGTLIGAIIAIVISKYHRQPMATNAFTVVIQLRLCFLAAKTRNYAFQVIFMTVVILLLDSSHYLFLKLVSLFND